MSVKYSHPRGTKAALDTLAASNSLVVGQVYFLTDENKLVIATSTSTYISFNNQSDVQTALNSKIAIVTTRAELAAQPSTLNTLFLSEGGREGTFIWQTGDLSAQVTADVYQGIYIAPEDDITGASGAWMRNFQGPLDVRWFGAALDNYTDDSVAVQAAFTLAATLQVSEIYYAAGAVPVYFAGFAYMGATSLNLSGDTNFRIIGNGAGRIGGGYRSGMRWAKNSDGIIHSAPLEIIGMFLYSAALGTTGVGITSNARIIARDCMIGYFGSHGIDIEASAGSTGTNANLWQLSRVSCWRNGGSGLVIGTGAGADANAGSAIDCDFSENARWGVHDSSFLGNTYINCHIDGNGKSTGYTPSLTSYNNNRYAVVAGQETNASINPPTGTVADNTYWYYLGTGGADGARIPAWTSGLTFEAGGVARTDDPNAHSVFLGCYCEAGQGQAQLVRPTLVIGGQIAKFVKGTAAVLNSGTNAIQTQSAWNATYNDATSNGSSQVGEYATTTKTLLQFTDSVAAPNSHRLKYSGKDITFDYQNLSGNRAFWITGPNTTNQFGTSAPVPHAFWPVKLMIGDSIANARQVTNGTSAPTSGTWGQGAVCFNRDYVAGGVFAWVCTTAGTPGTWDKLYALKSLSVISSGLTVTESNKLLGRSTADTGAVEEITCTAAARDLLDDVDTSAMRTTLEVPRGIGFHCAGVPSASEVIGGMISPYTFNITQANCTVKALVAATASTTITIKNNGTQIGTAVFAAAGTTATVTITSASVTAGDQITFHAPATPDATLADIDGLVRE